MCTHRALDEKADTTFEISRHTASSDDDILHLECDLCVVCSSTSHFNQYLKHAQQLNERTNKNDGKHIIRRCANNNRKTCSTHKCSGSNNNNSSSQQQNIILLYMWMSHIVSVNVCYLFEWCDNSRRGEATKNRCTEQRRFKQHLYLKIANKSQL